MSLRRFHRDLINIPSFDTTIIWGESQDGLFQNLPTLATETEIDYATALGVDAFKHVPFIERIGDDLVITWQEGLTDEDAKGQSITMKYIDKDGNISQKYTVVPAFSNLGSTDSIVPLNNQIIHYNGICYYLSTIFDTLSNNNPASWTTLGLLAVERIDATTTGTPFWVYTPDGNPVTPQTGFPSYSFNEPISSGIADKIRSRDFQLYVYNDTQPNDFESPLFDGSGDKFFEITAIERKNQFIRLSRNFSQIVSSAYFDFGDGVPQQTVIPSSPARQWIGVLRDGRVAMCGGGGSPLTDRLELWFAVADKNTLHFRQENIYRVIYGQDTGQQFPGAFKNGLWSYPHVIHDIDNKIKIVCSKYKEGIFLFEFDYADIMP